MHRKRFLVPIQVPESIDRFLVLADTLQYYLAGGGGNAKTAMNLNYHRLLALLALRLLLPAT